MIFPLSPIGNFSFAALPIWELEHTTDIKVETSCDPDVSAPVLTESVDAEWVFKGYRWQLEAPPWHPFVNPGWDHFVDNDPDEMRERAIRQEQERNALKAKVSPQAEAAMRADAAPYPNAAKAPEVSRDYERFGPPPVDPLGGRRSG